MLEPSSSRGPQSLKATLPPAVMLSVLTTMPWPIHLKWTGTSSVALAVWYHTPGTTRHNNEQPLSKKILHWAANTWHWRIEKKNCMEETWEHVSVHWHQGNYQLWVNCFMCWNSVTIMGFRVSWICSHTHYKVWDEITHLFPNFNVCTFGVWEWQSNPKL